MCALPVPDNEDEQNIVCKPFVKWAGGKGQLLPEILKRIPKQYEMYHEPFVGGGAVFFALQPVRATLSDRNEELINAYQVIRNQINELVNWLGKYRHDEEEFYRVRSLDRLPEFEVLPPYVRAARLIYLNKTCYNGLYRVNKSGHFNTPFGKYANPTIVDEKNLRACSKTLRFARLTTKSFEKVVETAKKGDFVYFDPPYPPISNTADFTSYTDKSFSWEDQVALRDVCDQLETKGVKFLLSNACTPEIEELYNRYIIDRVPAKRAINSKGGKRGEVLEVLVKNYR